MLLFTLVYMGFSDEAPGPTAAEAGVIMPTRDAINE